MNEFDDDVIVGLTRLFAEVGESYMNLIVSDIDCGQMQLIHAMLLCMEYQGEIDGSGEDNESSRITEMTLRFWHCLSRMLKERNDTSSQSKRMEYEPAFRRVAETCIRRCVLPRSVLLQPIHTPNVTARDGKRFSNIRIDRRIAYALCLKDVCIDMLSYNAAVTLCLNNLRAAANTVQTVSVAATSNQATQDQVVDAWCHYEGSLFACVSVANHREVSIIYLSEGAACEWSTVVIVIVIFIS